MAKNVIVGDEVYVPVARIANSSDRAHAMIRAKVVSRTGRKLKLSIGSTIVTAPSSAVHKDIGVCIFRIGDVVSEEGLLNPLADSIHRFLRLLLPDDQLRYFQIRTKSELDNLYLTNEALYTYFLFIGHGSAKAMHLAYETYSGTDLANFMSQHNRGNKPHNYISLCCSTGRARFAKDFSAKLKESTLIAPMNSLDGAIACQFVISLFAYHFLHGKTFGVAFKRAQKDVARTNSFRLWQDGCFVGPHSNSQE